jgi:hypothetical protein
LIQQLTYMLPYLKTYLAKQTVENIIALFNHARNCFANITTFD